MRIDIKNFAKIKEASVQIDGITVIAGENNTGKSTVGKVLFSLFNATVNMEEHVNNYRYEKIRSLVSWSVDNLHNRMLDQRISGKNKELLHENRLCVL